MRDLGITVRDSFTYMHMQLLRCTSIYVVNIRIYAYTHVCMEEKTDSSQVPRCANVGMLVCVGPSPVVSRAMYSYL